MERPRIVYNFTLLPCIAGCRSVMHLAYIVTCHCVSAMRVRYDNVVAAVVDTYIYLDQVT